MPKKRIVGAKNTPMYWCVRGIDLRLIADVILAIDFMEHQELSRSALI